MNAQKLTEKSLEAIQSANDMAISHQNQMIQQVHLLCALLEQENGLIPQLFEKVGVSKETAVRDLEQQINQLPSVTGSRQKSRFRLHRTGCRHGSDGCRKAGR